MEETFNMRRTFAGFTAVLLLLSFAISCEKPSISDENGASDNKLIDRELVNIEFTPEDGMSKSVTSDNGSDAWLSVSWNPDAEESISVYIQRSDGIYYAGDIVSPASSEAVRTFSGAVLSKEEGEKYIYLHPSLKTKEKQGYGAAGQIELSEQNGVAANLKDIMPCVWKETEKGVQFQRPVYFIKLTMNFESDPGTLTSLQLETMSRGAEDRVFPAAFKAANLGSDFNSSLAKASEGTSLSSDSDYTRSIVLSNWQTGSDAKQRIAYLMSSSVENLNVFPSKYRIVANTSTGMYYGEFRSFPNQGSEEVQESRQLAAFENGKVYRASRKMSVVPPATSINDNYRVYSLLGLWNEYGKPYDPDNMVISASALSSSKAPASLKNILGSSELQTEFTNQINKDTGASGTPNFLGRLYKSAGNSTDAGKTIKVTKDCEVFVTIVSENAWDRNLLGYYFFPFSGSDEASQPTSPATLDKYIVFPDVSRPYHVPFNTNGTGTTDTSHNIGSSADAPVSPYMTVQLIYKDKNGFSSKVFPAGTFIGFFVMNNAMKDRGDAILNWGRPRFFTNYGLSTANPSINPFAAGDIIKPGTDVTTYNGAGRLKDLGVFGFRDNVNDNANTAFATMIFVVSTQARNGEDALSMQNTAALNLSASTETNLVVGKTAAHTITRNISKGIICSDYTENLDGSQTSYSFTMQITDTLYGQFKDVLVKHGDVQVAATSQTKTSMTFGINAIEHDITIQASTTKIVKVKALTADQLNNLTAPDADATGESNYKLVLHCTNSTYSNTPTDGAFSFNGSGSLITLPFAQSPFWISDSDIVASASTGIEVNPAGRYNDYFLTLAKAPDSGFFLINASGKKICRGSAYYASTDWPKVEVDGTGTALVAEGAGNNGYTIYLKAKADNSKHYNYMTCRAGASAGVPIFYVSGGHVNTYGKWRVYKIWTE